MPLESEVLDWFDTLSNWGRWGDDDQRGTLNLITPEVRRRAARLVREGIRVSCSRDIESSWAGPMHRFMSATGQGLTEHNRVLPPPIKYHEGDGHRGAWAGEHISLPVHYQTHVDALCHMFWDGRMYNGKSAALVTSERGATVNDITAARDGVFTRGVLLDIAATRGVKWLEPGDGVFPEDLEAAEERVGLRVSEGDALLLRTGNGRRMRTGGSRGSDDAGQAGFHAACLPWLHERGIAVTATDTAHDVLPSGYDVIPLPLHYIGIAAMGLCTIDNADFEEVASICVELDRWDFLFTFDPLRIVGGTGSPVNVVATF
ncbi:hypothetical protein CU254_12805 [Amycolatopsis sp. AA4]|nr:hypothetical protein CU254_12805 [Amycolatopsis sp. AA4]